MQVLETHGACAFVGFFSDSHYLKEPTYLDEDVNDRPVYGWQEHDYCFDKKSELHWILIVKAAFVNQEEFVYYIDPSQPNTVFKISYQRFVENVKNIYATIRNPENKYPYGFYASNKLLLLKDDPEMIEEVNHQDAISNQFMPD